MAESARTLFSEILKDAPEQKRGTGILPLQEIRALIREKHIQATAEISDDQIQPASIDLRL
ncbi:MAG: 2'-deoxycytidine 5'-triphosphate deaminase, partial [Alphaproteobacteria bacterium]